MPKNGQLVVEKQHLRAITNKISWTTAFIVYMSVYLERCKGKAQDMRRYTHGIRLAASRVDHNYWSKYDEQYRFKKKRYPSSYWGGGPVDYKLCVKFVYTTTGLTKFPDSS